MPYCDINTDVKPWLGIDVADTEFDTTLTIIRDSVEQAVLNYIEVSLETVGPIMEVYDASQQDQITLHQIPVQSVDAVYFCTEPDGTGGKQIDTDCYGVDLDTGVIKLQHHYTPRGRLLVRVDYTHGYSSVPADVKHAILLGIEADFRRKTSKSIGRTSRAKKDEREGLDSGAGSWDAKSGLPHEVVFKLNTYRRFEFANLPIATRNL